MGIIETPSYQFYKKKIRSATAALRTGRGFNNVTGSSFPCSEEEADSCFLVIHAKSYLSPVRRQNRCPVEEDRDILI